MNGCPVCGVVGCNLGRLQLRIADVLVDGLHKKIDNLFFLPEYSQQYVNK
jgi:hypothetical protein